MENLYWDQLLIDIYDDHIFHLFGEKISWNQYFYKKYCIYFYYWSHYPWENTKSHYCRQKSCNFKRFFFRSESRHTIEETRSTYVSLLPLVSLLEWLQHNKRQKKLVSLKPHFSFFKKLFINKAKGRHEATFNEAYTAFMSYRKYIFFAQNVNIF